jgi:predicted alpha/beta superfamily hydrolase
MLARTGISFLVLTIGLLSGYAASPPPPQKAAITPTLIPLGEQHLLTSAILGDTREINVWVPPGIAEGRTPGAVIYLLDGALDQDFKHIAGLGELCALSWTCETTLIVGIQTKDRQHELTPAATDPRFIEGFPQAGGAGAFRRFIAEEVRPLIEGRYPAAPRTVLMGESLAGLFVIDTMLETPALFDDYVAISPSLWWDAGHLSQEAPARLAGAQPEGRRLYLAIADEGGAMQAGVDAMRAAIGAAAPEGFEFIFSDRSASETHATIYHGEALAALRRLYPMPPGEGEAPWWMMPDGAPPQPAG